MDKSRSELMDLMQQVQTGISEVRAELAAVRAEFDAVRQERDAYRQQRDALREALEAVEWSMIGDGCPSCYRHKSEGHWPSCQLDNTLALVRE